MRITLLTLWIVFLLGAAYWLSKHPQPAPATPIPHGCLTVAQKKDLPHWTAARDLLLNWRISSADLIAPKSGPQPPDMATLRGKHMQCKVKDSEPVILSDLGP